MPTIGLATLEHPLSFVARDRLVEQPLLGARVVQVVVDDLVAEQRACNRPALERCDRVAKRMWEARDVGLVGVALERRPELEPLLDPPATRAEQRGEGEIRIRVGPG